MHDGRARTEGMQSNTGAGPRLVGRDGELRAALGLLAGPGPRALILAGEPGIGKTTIWRELLGHARSRGFDVLRAMPSGAEVQLTFAALGDLVDGVGEPALARLATPQRRALEIALLRVEGAPVDARAVRVALLELLRNRASERPVLIGIDDLQWRGCGRSGACRCCPTRSRLWRCVERPTLPRRSRSGFSGAPRSSGRRGRWRWPIAVRGSSPRARRTGAGGRRPRARGARPPEPVR